MDNNQQNIPPQNQQSAPQPQGQPMPPYGTVPPQPQGQPMPPYGTVPPRPQGQPMPPYGTVSSQPQGQPMPPYGTVPPQPQGQPMPPYGTVPPRPQGQPMPPYGAVPPYGVPMRKPLGKGFGITSMVLGIMSILMMISNDFDIFGASFAFIVLAYVFGIISLAQKRDGKGFAIAGVVLASVTAIVEIIILILSVVLIAAIF